MNRTLGLVFLLAGCYSPNIGNGQLKCSSDNKCPDGFHCAGDKTCWKNGQEPMPSPMPDMSVLPDLATPVIHDMTTPSPMPDLLPPALPTRAGNSVMTGGVTAKSEHYKMIMSTGQPPGGNGASSSANNKKRSGTAGATQGK